MKQPTSAGAATPPILVVENNPGVRQSLEWLLRSEGYFVVTAIHGADALRKLQAGLRPCLILLDLEMPEMDGFEFRSVQLKDPQLADIPVVVCSSLMDPEVLATQITATAHLGKLFDVATLLMLVEQHCTKRSAAPPNKPPHGGPPSGGSSTTPQSEGRTHGGAHHA